MSADTIVPGAGALTIDHGGESGGGTGNPQQLNRYSYVLNNPIKSTDPTGHDTVQFGVGFRVGLFGWGGAQISAGVALDDKGNYGIYLTETPKQANVTVGYALSASGSAGFSTASTISDLEGIGVQTGGSGGIIGRLGIDTFSSLGGGNPGMSLSVGLGPSLEDHLEMTGTAVMQGGNLRSDVQSVERGAGFVAKQVTNGADVAGQKLRETAAGIASFVHRQIFQGACTSFSCTSVNLRPPARQ